MKEDSIDKLIALSQEHTVRFATQADLPHIAHIARVTWDVTYNNTIAPENRREFLERAYKLENLETVLDASGHWLYVSQLKDELVAFGHFLKRYHPNISQAELVRLYVLPEYQNLNIGYTILQTGFAALAEVGIKQCFVSVQASNKLARRFYERYNFSFRRKHGQFLGTQIITMVEYVRPIKAKDLSL